MLPEYVSHETIYQLIYQDYKGISTLSRYLRRSNKKRQIRISMKSRRGQIINRVGIEEQPAIADKKTEKGNYEHDLIIGANHAGAVVTCVDKASRYLLAEVIPDKTADSVNKATEKMFKTVPVEKRKTLTSDNGKEFSGHEKLAATLKISWYFARPYHSWERGLNEHTNGLIRQFFPKSTNFKTVKPEKLQKVVNLINHRPRKCLDYRTPHEVSFEELGAIALQI
ncbi:IS30 family transposase [Anthocerotibacter panamensis]|uniref:IS30 family transposase n=1 Tax=Anthocerotibacter panamensis TaxID=2857077 RepID=UPI001FD9AF8E|nr:IS30 family transposase [Anthocerotibacter panamensis]